ncbi:MAG: class I SAM-dependent methyltransferase [Bacteroidia bacterium]|nr:class I SAM-dependent methyltransferase [Bacteroidia bacterium]
MQNLTRGLKLCRFENGKVIPCEYHENRSTATIHKLSDGSGEQRVKESRQVIHRRTPDIIRLSHLFNKKADPAGSWYLVQEQREWLHNQLVDVLTSYLAKDEECFLLEAGVASYVHHYTFMDIVIEACGESGFPLNKLHVDIVDKCITPLYQIASIERSLRHKLFLGKHYRIFDRKFRMSSQHQTFLKKRKEKLKQINVKLFLRDLRQLEDIQELGSYDVITEHFLTSMIGKQRESMDKVRESYSRLLKKGGVLLSATGVRDQEFWNNFLSIHIQHGLRPELKTKTDVWDPYGIERGTIVAIGHNPDSSLVAAQDNTMIRFTRMV